MNVFLVKDYNGGDDFDCRRQEIIEAFLTLDEAIVFLVELTAEVNKEIVQRMTNQPYFVVESAFVAGIPHNSYKCNLFITTPFPLLYLDGEPKPINNVSDVARLLNSHTIETDMTDTEYHAPSVVYSKGSVKFTFSVPLNELSGKTTQQRNQVAVAYAKKYGIDKKMCKTVLKLIGV